MNYNNDFNRSFDFYNRTRSKSDYNQNNFFSNNAMNFKKANLNNNLNESNCSTHHENPNSKAYYNINFI
jgi:hypothetical protein